MRTASGPSGVSSPETGTAPGSGGGRRSRSSALGILGLAPPWAGRPCEGAAAFPVFLPPGRTRHETCSSSCCSWLRSAQSPSGAGSAGSAGVPCAHASPWASGTAWRTLLRSSCTGLTSLMMTTYQGPFEILLVVTGAGRRLVMGWRTGEVLGSASLLLLSRHRKKASSSYSVRMCEYTRGESMLPSAQMSAR